MIYKCEQCHNPFKAPPSQKARFCKRDCYDQFRQGVFACDECGKIFIYYKSHKNGKRVFCSRSCQVIFQNKSPFNHPHWKGKGYRKLIEHITGKKLGGSDVVHHINGNHSDNRIENLQITTRSEHALIHKDNSPFQKGHKQFNTGRTWFKKK